MRINYMEKINIKRVPKKMKDSQVSEIIIALNYCKLSASSLAMITQFLKMSINESVILRCK